MKDFDNNEIKVGDLVLFTKTKYHQLCFGIVYKLNKKQPTIIGNNSFKSYPIDRVFVINDSHKRMLTLKKQKSDLIAKQAKGSYWFEKREADALYFIEYLLENPNETRF